MIEASREETLVARASAAFAAFQSGDRAAFDTLVSTVTPLLWHVARSQGTQQTEAEDVVQSVWLSLIRSADSVRDPQTVVKWLLTSTRREAWRVTKRSRADVSKTVAMFGVEGEEVVAVPDDPLLEPDAIVAANEQHQLLWRHLDELPERCRTLLRVIAYADRPDYAHIAESLGMPVGSIGPTRGRCLAKLKDILDRDPEWEGSLS
ncbi:MAG: sigma-70 family RNA polymerase sigma factor [Nocardioidaceae bacterium]